MTLIGRAERSQPAFRRRAEPAGRRHEQRDAVEAAAAVAEIGDRRNHVMSHIAAPEAIALS